MLCPKCKKAGKDIKMGVIDSRWNGAFKKHRQYRCPDCKYIDFSTEKLEIDEWVTGIFDKKTKYS